MPVKQFASQFTNILNIIRYVIQKSRPKANNVWGLQHLGVKVEAGYIYPKLSVSYFKDIDINIWIAGWGVWYVEK